MKEILSNLLLNILLWIGVTILITLFITAILLIGVLVISFVDWNIPIIKIDEELIKIYRFIIAFSAIISFFLIKNK